MKKLYYIEEETFLRDMLEALCRSEGDSEAFTAAEGSDNLYFFTDISPDFILVDWSTVQDYEAKLLEDLAQVSQIPVGLTKLPDTEIPAPWLERSCLVLEKPLEAKSLLKNIFAKL